MTLEEEEHFLTLLKCKEDFIDCRPTKRKRLSVCHKVTKQLPINSQPKRTITRKPLVDSSNYKLLILDY